MKKNKSLLFITTAIALFILITPKIKALVYEKSFYDAISWIYTYQAPATNSYNCLGWATGSMTWEWPTVWGEGATKSVVDQYFIGKGYMVVGETATLKTIVAYGPSTNKITHFAKVQSGNVTAKWGQLERFSHGISLNPYYEDSVYGLARSYYLN